MQFALRLGSVAVTVVSLVGAWYGQRILHHGADRLAGVWFLVGGAGLVAAAIWGSRRVAAGAAAESSPILPGALEPLAVAGLLLLAGWVRLSHFDTIPIGMNHDAAWNGMYATYIRNGAEWTPYTAAAWGRETLFMYAIAPFQMWLGNSMAAVQAASTFVGLLALVPIYLLARDLFGRTAGVAGLAFFAVSGWHWVFSRVGWRCITVPPFEALALLGLWRALRRGGTGAWLLTGAATAASIYTYNAARGIPLVIAGLAIAHLAVDRRRWREILSGGVKAALAFLIVGAPMLWYAANNWVKFEGRAAHLLDQRAAELSLASNLADALAMFNYRGNGNDFFVTQPLLEPLAGVLLVVGGWILVSRVRQASARFVTLGFLLALVPGILSFPNGNRCITAMPFVFAAIGLAAASTCRAVATLWPSRAGLWAARLLLLGMVAQAGGELYREYLGSSRAPLRGVSAGATAAGEFLSHYGEDYRAYAVSENWPRYTLMYLGYSHGSALEPALSRGRSFAEIEGQVSRFGRKGLVLITDLGASGRAAREGIRRIFAQATEKAITASRLGGRQVGRAVIVEPRMAGRTALWSNVSRVLAIGAGEGVDISGSYCRDAVATGRGVSVRLGLMVPQRPVAGELSVRLVGSCSDGRRPADDFTLSVSAAGIAVKGPVAVTLVEAEAFDVGRWYDFGLVVDAHGTAHMLVDGRRVELGAWPGCPPQLAGLVVDGPGRGEDAPVLYFDDYGVSPRPFPDESPWWRGGRVSNESAGFFEDFEGLPLGDLAGRPGWEIGSGKWATRAGPGVGGAVEEVAQNAFDGGKGKTPGRFDEPMGIAADAAGNLYVSERLNHRVQKFASDGTYLSQWGRLGSKPGEFREPLDVAVEGDRLYVLDTWNTRIQVFDLDGNYLSQIGPDPVLGKPRGLFVRDGKVYVANSGRGNVLVFDTTGKLLSTFPSGDEPLMHQVVDLVVDSKGRVYVNNSQMNRLEVFAPDGKRLGDIAIADWKGPHLKEFYMAIDADDTIYISDWDLHRVRRVTTDGEELSPIGPKMDRPSGLVVSGDRLIIVSRGDSVLRVADLSPAAAPALRHEPSATGGRQSSSELGAAHPQFHPRERSGAAGVPANRTAGDDR